MYRITAESIEQIALDIETATLDYITDLDWVELTIRDYDIIKREARYAAEAILLDDDEELAHAMHPPCLGRFHGLTLPPYLK